MPTPKLTLDTRLKALQEVIGATSDGLIGPESLTLLEQALSIQPPLESFSLTVSRPSLDALIAFEVTSEKNYNNRLKTPIWPGGESGITIGIGYDLGFNPASGIRADWSKFIPEDSLGKLASVANLKGAVAKSALSKVKAVTVPYEAAKEVFFTRTLPRFARQTKDAYPGVEDLMPDAQGALLSLIYNRGASLSNKDSRKEMRAIRDLVPGKDYAGIAAQLRSMKRLWIDANLQGLLRRRDEEAELVENAVRVYTPNELIRV